MLDVIPPEIFKINDNYHLYALGTDGIKTRYSDGGKIYHINNNCCFLYALGTDSFTRPDSSTVGTWII